MNLLKRHLNLLNLYKSENDMNQDIDELAFESYKKTLGSSIEVWESFTPEQKSIYLSKEKINNLNDKYQIDRDLLIKSINQYNFYDNHCSKFRISKIYKDIEKLKLDNGHNEVYVDDEFDVITSIFKLFKILMNNYNDLSPELASETAKKELIESIPNKYKFFNIEEEKLPKILDDIKDVILSGNSLQKEQIKPNTYALLLYESKKLYIEE